MDSNALEQATIVQVQVSLGEIKGILTTSLAENARRIQNVENVGISLRKDLTDIANTTVTHTANISDIRGDVAEIRDRVHNGLSKSALILSPVVAIAALIWNVIGK
jgi:hypothetical protein